MHDRSSRINVRVSSRKAGVEVGRMQNAIDSSYEVINEYKDWKNGFDDVCTSKY